MTWSRSIGDVSWLFAYLVRSLQTSLEKRRTKLWHGEEAPLPQSLDKTFGQVLWILDHDGCCSKFTTLVFQILVKLRIGIGGEVASVEFARDSLIGGHDVVAKS